MPRIQSAHIHSVADSDVRDTSADLLDDACRVEAKDGGVFLDDNIECLDLPFDRVEPSCLNFDEDLARARLLNVTLLHGKLALGLEEVESLLSRHVGCRGCLVVYEGTRGRIVLRYKNAWYIYAKAKPTWRRLIRTTHILLMLL